jgi:hypothetical protein
MKTGTCTLDDTTLRDTEMSRQFELITQYPKPRDMGPRVLSVDRHGDAQFFCGLGDADARVLAVMKSTRLESASADGIMLSGMEPAGVDRQAREVLKYQEWWLRYPRVSSA